MTDIQETLERVQEGITNDPLTSKEEIEAFRIRYFGRNQGLIHELTDHISELPAEERPEFGRTVNRLKQQGQQRIEEARERLEREQTAPEGELEIDLTLPGRRPFRGSLHPLSQTLADIERIFNQFGFETVEGPEIEDDWHNFSALNFPEEHPARDMQDTFFLSPPPPEGAGTVLRTHTSPVQIRVMEEEDPPHRMIAPGRVYRNEAISFKSYCLFYQVEGLYVDEHVTFAELKHLLDVFVHSFFGSEVDMRFRPSFFPFTEPSAEVDIRWPSDGTSESEWMEVLGCGMVDPNVLEAVDLDPEKYSGYAFGLGVDRLTMLRHGIEDIRLLYENDLRFLNQF